MNFLIVNDRVQRNGVNCAMCGEPIQSPYVREIGTHILYCCEQHYEWHCYDAAISLGGSNGYVKTMRLLPR